jgi:hypothetical protein
MDLLIKHIVSSSQSEKALSLVYTPGFSIVEHRVSTVRESIHRQGAARNAQWGLKIVEQ